MAFIGKITDTDGVTGLIGSTLYGTCATEAATVAKVGTLADFDTLMTGVTIHIKFTYSNTATDPTLNVNGTGAKRIYKAGTTSVGTTVATSWAAGSVISLTYDGSAWIMNDHTDDANSVTGVKGNAESSYRTGNVNLTPANIGALPLSGGTMTGPLTMKGEQYSGNYGLNMNNSDIIGANRIIFADEAAVTEGLVFWRSADTTDNFWIKAGEMYFTPNYPTATTNNVVLHTGNLGTYVKASSNNGKISVNGSDVTVYTHPTYVDKTTADFYKTKITNGHISEATAIASADVSAFLNLLSTGSSTPNDNDYYISQYVGGGTTTTTYHRRPMSALASYVRTKLSVTSSGSGPVVTGMSYSSSTGVLTYTKGRVLSTSGGQWIAGRDNAPLFANSGSSTAGNFFPAIAVKSNTGAWSIGALGSGDSLAFSFSTDTNYSGGTNTTNNYYIGTDGAFTGTAAGLTTKTITASTVDTTPGSFVFGGTNIIGGINDWVGFQADAGNDRFQIIANSQLVFRQNDGATIEGDWGSWLGCITPNNVSGDTGITITKTTTTIGTGDNALTYDSGVKISHTNSISAQTSEVFKKFKYDAQGHITGVAAVAKADITALGIPAQDTTYSAGNHLSLSSTTFSLASYCKTITDWNDTKTTGWYMGSGVTNAPSSAWWMGRVTAHNAKYCIQEVWQFTASTDGHKVPHKMRMYVNEVWGNWVDITVGTAVPENAVFTDANVAVTKLAASTADASYYATFASAEGTSGLNIMDSIKFNHTKGTTSADGNSRLILGNSTASGTANNEEGLLRLYSPGTSYHTIKGASTNSAVDHTLPTTGGTILNTGTTGSSTTNGKVKINGSDVTVYTHPTATAQSSGLYKITVNGTGHVTAATAAGPYAGSSSDGGPANLLAYTHSNEINFSGGKKTTCYFNYRDADTDAEDTGETPIAINYKFCDYRNSTANTTITAANFDGNATSANTLSLKSLAFGSTLDTTNGLYAFTTTGSIYGSDTSDWVGMQIGSANDRFQIMGSVGGNPAGKGTMLIRANDVADSATGRDTGWSKWSGVMTADTIAAGTGISLSYGYWNGSADSDIKISMTIGHSNSIGAQSTAVFKKFAYDECGHITGVDTVAGTDLPAHTHTHTKGGEWIKARDNANLYVNPPTISSSYYPAIFAKTKDGGWSMGVLGGSETGNVLYVTYTTDANYAADSNTNTYLIQFPKDSGTLALTKNCVTKSGDTMTGLLTMYREGTTAQNYPAGFKFSVKDTTTGQTYNDKAYIYAYQDHASTTYGTNMVINSGGCTFIGAGEAGDAHYSAIKENLGTSEYMYLTADSGIYIQGKGNSIANRCGIYLDNAHNIVPCVADTSTNNVGSIGTSSYKWNAAYFNNTYSESVGKNCYIAYPDGGIYNVTGSSSVEGAFLITTPITTSQTCMVKFTVDIYNGVKGTSTEYKISGFANSDGKWYYTSAIALGGTSKTVSNTLISNLTVRFGYQNNKFCVQIGEVRTSNAGGSEVTAGTKWAWPKVVIHDIMITHNATSYDTYKSGWSISLFNTKNTPISNITATHNNTNVSWAANTAALSHTNELNFSGPDGTGSQDIWFGYRKAQPDGTETKIAYINNYKFGNGNGQPTAGIKCGQIEIKTGTYTHTLTQGSSMTSNRTIMLPDTSGLVSVWTISWVDLNGTGATQATDVVVPDNTRYLKVYITDTTSNVSATFDIQPNTTISPTAVMNCATVGQTGLELILVPLQFNFTNEASGSGYKTYTLGLVTGAAVRLSASTTPQSGGTHTPKIKLILACCW